jgi:plastocyanin
LSVVNATGTDANATDLAAAAPDTAAQIGANATESNATETAETGATGSNATESAGANATGAGATGGGTTTGVSITSGSSTKTTDAFAPNPVQVSTGTTVTWTNDDAQPHTATSGENATPDGRFDTGILAPAATFDFQFTEAGEYPYFCLLHPNMVGSVSVS